MCGLGLGQLQGLDFDLYGSHPRCVNHKINYTYSVKLKTDSFKTDLLFHM